MHLITIVLLFSLWNVCHSYRKSLQRRVFSGDPDSKNEFAFVVVVEMNTSPHYRLCSGSLLNPTMVLTSAHCVYDAASRIIRFGDFTKHPDETKSYARIIKTFIHPSYDEELLKNDIALLHIEKVPNLVFGKISAVDFKSLIGLPVKYGGFGLTSWGFIGKMKTHEKNPRLSIRNMTTPIQVGEGLVVPCEKLDYGVICVAPKCSKANQEIRSGDDGAPLILRGKIVAVSTLGYPEDLPIVNFSPLSPYLDWIHDIITSVPEKKSD